MARVGPQRHRKKKINASTIIFAIDHQIGKIVTNAITKLIAFGIVGCNFIDRFSRGLDSKIPY